MKRTLPAVGAVLLASTAWAALAATVLRADEHLPASDPNDPDVIATVFRADEQTPLPWADPNLPDVYQDIMVGTRLTIFITSDGPGPWSGRFWHSWENAAIGAVSGRDEDPNALGYEASILPAAGEKFVRVNDVFASDKVALDMACGVLAVPGEWFVVDYHAQTIGTCELGLYITRETVDEPNEFHPGFVELPSGLFTPIQGLTFHHVPSRDFDSNHLVDFADFATLADAWGATAAVDPNQPEITLASDPNTPVSPDLNADTIIDTVDLALFCEYWLETTDLNEPTADPNEPPSDPNEPQAEL